MSSMSTSQEFTLSDLPADVIRGIMASAWLESINGMMLISPRWHSVALDQLSDRNRLPAIKSLSWSTETDDKATIAIFVSPKYQNYLGLDRWQSKELTETLEDINDGSCLLFEKVVENARIEYLLARLVSRCSQVERLEITGFDFEKVNINQMNILMRDLMPEELFLSDVRGRKLSTYRRPSRAASFSSSMITEMALAVETVTLNLDTVNFLGIQLVGQRSARGDDGIYVANVTNGGAVALDGRIEPGDMVLQVNEVVFDNATNDQAVDAIRAAVARKGTIRLTVAKRIDNYCGGSNAEYCHIARTILPAAAKFVPVAESADGAGWSMLRATAM